MTEDLLENPLSGVVLGLAVIALGASFAFVLDRLEVWWQERQIRQRILDRMKPKS